MALPFATPSSLAEGFSISYCTSTDVDIIADIYYDTFATDKRNAFWWPPNKEDMFTWMKVRVLRKMDDRRVRHFKVTDGKSGDVVAFARWDIPEGYEKAFGEWVGDDGSAVEVSQTVKTGENTPANSAPVEAVDPPTADYPKGSNPELCKVFFDALKVASEKYDADAMLGLSLLCTSPKYYRRGAAKALLEPMLAIADAHGLKSYLEATPNGKRVYEKLGFREVGRLNFDLKELTGEDYGDMYHITVMIREPRST
ncbi:acyl-CoA N-acyltransferase [Daldinia caldariorum]|uniref:acyl-CoA N-acyltransferase n=1 Tax=Daldinia caldariorum TaxID=326644 RepID=UPI002008AF95|nr:acyl-CoA N-acyltransferase [Daldinia caldariorum]KAI1468019.1 acyl-CoA N-acyltransferase [Daldinia caldariorum]